MAKGYVRSVSNRAKWILYPTATLVFCNFNLFIIGSLYLGGDALNGHVQDAHYFLCSHGSCNEVTHSIWNYSWWHAQSMIWGIVLVFFEMAVLVNTKDICIEFRGSA